VGRQLVRAALDRKCAVVAFARQPTQLSGVAASGVMDVRAWDAAETPFGPGTFSGVDILIHAAALVPEDMSDSSAASACFRTNAMGTLEAVRAAQRAGVRHFIFLSTGQVYSNPGRPARESDPAFPDIRAPYYLISKLAGEVFASNAARELGVELTTLRLGSIYGPGTRAGHLVARFCRSALANEPIIVDAPGTHTSDFVHLDDVVQGVLAAAERAAGGTLNLGTGVATTVKELAELVAAVGGRSPALVRMRDQGEAPLLAGFAALDSTRARGALGYEPRELRRGLAETLAAMASC
jgi:nucleoside-diphosphate-sugar epimerase